MIPISEFQSGDEISLVPRRRIQTRAQMRKTFESDHLKGLADSIRSLRAEGAGILGTGILQALTGHWESGAVKANGSIKPTAKVILDIGESRFLATELAGFAPDIDDKLIKTALFQLKKSNDLNLTLEREQLEDATLDTRTKTRAFVLAVDETRQIVRLHDVQSLLSSYNATQETKTFQSTRWESLSRWVWKWLSCDIGEPSEPNDPNSVEGLLQQFIVPEGLITSWGRRVEYDLPEDFAPARLWLKLYFESRES